MYISGTVCYILIFGLLGSQVATWSIGILVSPAAALNVSCEKLLGYIHWKAHYDSTQNVEANPKSKATISIK